MVMKQHVFYVKTNNNNIHILFCFSNKIKCYFFFVAAAGIDTTLIPDSNVFAMIARCNKVIISAQAVLADGGLVHTLQCQEKKHNSFDDTNNRLRKAVLIC